MRRRQFARRRSLILAESSSKAESRHKHFWLGGGATHSSPAGRSYPSPGFGPTSRLPAKRAQVSRPYNGQRVLLTCRCQGDAFGYRTCEQCLRHSSWRELCGDTVGTFTAVARVQIPSGTPNLFNHLQSNQFAVPGTLCGHIAGLKLRPGIVGVRRPYVGQHVSPA
jgi:hypothetical protein